MNSDKAWDIPVMATLSDILNSLERIKPKLTLIGMLIFSLTLLNVLWLVIHIVQFSPLTKSATVLVSAFIFILVAILVAFYDLKRRAGFALIEQLSERAQREVFEQPKFESTAASFEPRRAIRSFNAVVDLPLIPGKFGPLSYIIINLLVLLSIASTRPYLF